MNGARRPNVLLITLDQFRGDCLSCAGHPVVRTPNLDRLAAEGVRMARHYSQAAPCSPGRASLYTGMYQMNHRVVANGTGLDARFDNVALAARRAGYRPALFGYTDQSIDPRQARGPDDDRLSRYDGVLPGFDPVMWVPEDHGPWLEWLDALGYDASGGADAMLETEPERPAEHSLAAYLTAGLLEWIAQQDDPWFAHLSQLRPHPPYRAAGAWSTAYDPDDVDLPITPGADRHPFHDFVLPVERAGCPPTEAEMRVLRAQYYGMIGHVDHELGRLWDGLAASGAWDDTVVIVTADHGDMLGDHGLLGKLGYWDQSFHILGFVRDPRRPAGHGTVVEAFTENVDLMPTICDAIGVSVPAQCDGFPLTAFLSGGTPPSWRDAAHWEFDWRDVRIVLGAPTEWPWRRETEQCHLAVDRSDSAAYVQFGDGSWRCFDLATDPTWRTELTDAGAVLRRAQSMLLWRSRHADRTLCDLVLTDGGIGRWPAMPPGWPADVASG